MIVVHLLLLAVHSWDHSKAVPQPAWEKGFAVGDQGRKFVQLSDSQLYAGQLFSNGLPAFCPRPFFAPGQFQIGSARFLCRIGQFMAGMRNLFPENVHRRFQVPPALVQQINVGGILDVGRRHRCIQNQLPPVLFPAALLLFGRIGVCFRLSP